MCLAARPPARCQHCKGHHFALLESLRVFAFVDWGLEWDLDAALLREEVGSEAEADAVADSLVQGRWIRLVTMFGARELDRDRFRRLSQSLEGPSFEGGEVYSSTHLPRQVRLLEYGL